MGEDYNAVIEDFRSRGKSDEYIANVLMYDPKYKLDPNKARALLNVGSKKKEEGGNPFTISSSISSDIVLASLKPYHPPSKKRIFPLRLSSGETTTSQKASIVTSTCMTLKTCRAPMLLMLLIGL